MKTARALLLVLALSTITYAGEMGNGSPQPPPAQTTSESAPSANESTDGDMGNGAAENTAAAEAVLDLIQTLLALI